ncbi:MAG: ferritin-like domain-containing protein [Rhodospirillales bacterium]|nr:ferritin-like domain-containing protein [Rhodospirillales bacterium]
MPDVLFNPAPTESPLHALADKAERAQWRAADVAGWDEDMTLPWWLPRKFCAAVVSQLFHGEQATLKMCHRLLAEIEAPAARRCLELQIADEERHARVFLDYLSGIGGLQPIDPVLAAAYDKALAWTGPPEGLIAAFNIILEGEALYALDYLAGWIKCPLFRRIKGQVAKDEARHLAFGRLYLESTLGAFSPDQRQDLYDWLKDLWHDTAFGVLGKFRIPNFILRRRCRAWATTGWRDQQRVLAGVGLVAQ